VKQTGKRSPGVGIDFVHVGRNLIMDYSNEHG
jgi:hypothetical protein